MRTLVQAFHPKLRASRVCRPWADAALEAGCVVRDLYALYPDGRIDVPAEQAIAEAFDRLVFLHPLHWYAAPWLMKRWIDEVLQFGWAYGDRCALEGKVWLNVVSVGAVIEEYGPEGNRRYTVAEFLRPYERTAAFCGMRWEEPVKFYGAGVCDEDAVRASVAEVVRRMVGAA